MIRLRHMITLSPSSNEITEICDESLVTFAPMEAISDGIGGLDTSNEKPLSHLKNGSYNYFSDGDLLLAKVTPCFENGKKALAKGLKNGFGYATSEVYVIRPIKIYGKFLLYLFSSEDFRYEGIKSMTGAGGLKRIGDESILEYRPNIQSIDLQKKVVKFLDYQTTRIDNLIAHKKRFIELLKEKRQALITQAVTKGLNPNVPMKDSGVEWLGKVPEHWGVVRLKHIAEFSNSNVDKNSYEGQKVVYLCNYKDVYYNEFIGSSKEFMKATASDYEIAKFSIEPGDVLITKDSEDPLDIGIPSLIVKKIDSAVCGYHLTIIRSGDKDTSRFIHRSIQSQTIKAYFFERTPGITRYGLSQDTIGSLPIALPPSRERQQIANAIDHHTTRVDNLIKATQESIDLLKERRSALITAAVTGKIDVRGEIEDSEETEVA